MSYKTQSFQFKTRKWRHIGVGHRGETEEKSL